MSKKLDFKKISIHEGPKQSPGFLLWHISTSWRSSIEAALKILRLTHPQFVVLATTGWLTRNGHLVTQVEIGKMAGLDPNTNSQILKGLEQKSFITRTPSSDGRAKNVSLTPKGSQTLKRALPTVEQADKNFFNSINESEINVLTDLFQKLMPKSFPD